MRSEGYSANVASEWKDFTPHHARARDQALAVARGDHAVPAGAIVGVYGSGKSTLLLTVLARIREDQVLPVWEEAASFLSRLIPPGERVSPQEFVGRAHRWLEGIRTDPDLFAQYRSDLERRRQAAIAESVEAALRNPTARTVLLLDEMEQAYSLFLQRIETADQQPLRAFIDSCGNSTVRLLMAYAPESFHNVGDADKGRMLRIPVPGLNATAIQQAFGLARGQANFAWWASRGRARGVVKVAEEVIGPHARGDFDGTWRGLAQALDALPPVFGVPALLRERLEVSELPKLLNLAPASEDAGATDVIETRNRPALAEKLLQTLANSTRVPREKLEVVVDELLDVLDAVCDDEYRCWATFDDFSAAVKLAVARAIESGQLTETIDGLEPGRAYYAVVSHSQSAHALPFSLERLTDELFPSPFTDPILPMADGRVPSLAEVERAFDQSASDDVVFRWPESQCLVFRNMDAVEWWLAQGLAAQDDTDHWRALLLEEEKERGPLVALAQEAGRLALKVLPKFHGVFVKCLAVRAHDVPGGDSLERVMALLRASDRQLGRKVDWHLARIARLVDELEPLPHRRWLGAIKAARGESFTVLSRLAEDSPGLLAILSALKPCRAETRKLLAELSDSLAENSPLRKLAKAAGAGKRLEGAAVVVDELLPGRAGSGSKQRWIETNFEGRDDLRAVLDEFAPKGHHPILGTLLHPHAAQRMEQLVRFHAGELPDVKPDRLKLDAIQGISGVLQRARLVHKRIAALLGGDDEARGLAIGAVLNQALGAQKAITSFNRLCARIDRIEEPWAKTLALWVASVFADRIWDGVEHDEASLKEWEAVADSGKDLARDLDVRNAELRDSGLPNAASFLAEGRGRLRGSISDPAQMLAGMDALRGDLEQVCGISEALQQFKASASERATDVSELLKSYRPIAGRVADDRALLAEVSELLAGIDGDWPAPGADDLDVRAYLRRVRTFAEESRADRMRNRLANLVGLPVVSKDIVLDSNDIREFEETWESLPEDFARACRETIEAVPPGGSDKLVVWVKEALEKGRTLAAWSAPEMPRLVALDAKARAWATAPSVRPNQLEDAAAARSKAHQTLRNLSRSVEGGVLDEIIDAADAAAPGLAMPTLESEARSFQVELDVLAQKFGEVAGQAGVHRPFPGSSRALVLSELDAARRVAEQTRDTLRKRIDSLSSVIERLGGRPRVIPSPLSNPDAKRIIEALLEDARVSLDSAWANLLDQVRPFGIQEESPPLPSGATISDEGVSSLEAARAQCVQLGDMARVLRVLGVPLPSADAKTLSRAVEAFSAAVHSGESELRELKDRIRVLRQRLARLGGGRSEENTTVLTSLAEARHEVQALQAAVDHSRTQRLAQASESAQHLYRSLVDSMQPAPDVPPPIRELQQLGLLRTVEDEL